MIELTINLIHKSELILFMAVDFIDETIFKTYFFRKICRFTLLHFPDLLYYFCYIIRNVLKLLLYEKNTGLKKIVRSLKMELTSFFILWTDCYLSLLKYVRIFFMILIPKTTPSKMAMPVLNERMSESALLAAGCKRRRIFRGWWPS